jgi:toxin ParE1/3/4
MARFRLARPAEADIARLLATSAHRWGVDARLRYASLLSAAMQQVASDPTGRLTRDRRELRRGLRSFHLRHTQPVASHSRVRTPVHVLFYREAEPGVIEIVRVLHERMEPGRYVSEADPLVG